MTTKSRTLRVCWLFLALSIAIVACNFGFNSSHLNDANLIRNFEQHEQEFNRLIQMAKEDSHVVRIAYDFTWLDTNYHWPRPDSEIGITKDRWDQYRQMFLRLGLKEGLSWTSDGSLILITSAKGLMTDGSAKGYIFSTKPLSPTFDSLDHMGEEIKSGKIQPGLPVYRKIKENWYLYYEGD